MRTHIFDTGGIIGQAGFMKECIEKGDKVILPWTVWTELTNMKDGHLDKNRIARNEINYLTHVATSEQFNILPADDYVQGKRDGHKYDTIIVNETIRYIQMFGDSEAITFHTSDKDVAVLIQALKGTKGYTLNHINRRIKELETGYKGYRFITEEEDVRQVSSGNLDKLGFHANEYVVIKTGNRQELKRYDAKKKKLVPCRGELKGITPMNIHQQMAIDLLSNKEIPIKILAGTFGCGKTFLATHHAWNDGRGIVLVRNPEGDTDSKDVGYLKGDLDDKIMAFFKPIIDQLPAGWQDWERKKRENDLEYSIPLHMKGRSLDEKIMVVDEAEDLTVKTLKMLGSRIGKNGEVIFSGDYKQTESRYVGNNGLIHLIDQTQDLPLVGVVVMQEDVRSEASKVFADL